MKKLLLIFVLLIISLNDIIAQMPTDGDFSTWNWEDNSSNNWKRKKNNDWLNITPPFSNSSDKTNLIREIYLQKDYTQEKGWRLIHANFDGTFPYFVLYNINSSLLRGFIYTEGDAGIPYGSSILMTITPDENLKSTKLFHLSEDIQYAISDKRAEAKFSKNSLTAATTAGLNSWAALEIPLLFDNTISDVTTNWTIEFFAGTNSKLSFNIEGTSVPMDSNGNNLFAHPDKLTNGSSLKADYAKVHSGIKGFAEWGDKIQKHADGLSVNDKSPNFIKKYKSTFSKLGTTVKLASSVTQMSAGIELALGIFDSFFGGSSNTIPVGYSHSFTGAGEITSLKYLRANTLSVPGSQNTFLESWNYNCPLGVINLENTPTVKVSSRYITFSGFPNGLNSNGKIYHGYASGNNGLIYFTYNPWTISSQSKEVYYLSMRKPSVSDAKTIVNYRLYDNINLNIKSGTKIIESKFALICKENDEQNLTTKVHEYYFEGTTSYLSPGLQKKITRLTYVINPTYTQLDNGTFVLYDFDRSTKSFIYGTPYMSIDDLRKVDFKTIKGGDMYLGVIVKYQVDGDNEIRYFKGTYKVNLQTETLSKIWYVGTETPDIAFLKTTYPAKTTITEYGCDYSASPVKVNSFALSQKQDFNNIAISTYPNPSNGIFNLQIFDYENDCTVEVFNFSGKRVYFNNKVKNTVTFDLSQERKGIYLVKITSDNIVRTEKIILQ